MWDLVGEQFYTRKDDLDKLIKDNKGKIKDSETAVQMKYNVELLPTGTRFYHEFALFMPTKLELSAFGELMNIFKAVPYIGGRSSRGHGKVELNYETEFPDNKIYLDFVKDNREEITSFLQKLG
jgi:CRISPR/Cas system CSM-associated protein Csm3 (group 7 of RAMP superfamily)